MICNQASGQRMALWLAFEYMSVFDDILSFRCSDLHKSNKCMPHLVFHEGMCSHENYNFWQDDVYIYVRMCWLLMYRVLAGSGSLSINQGPSFGEQDVMFISSSWDASLWCNCKLSALRPGSVYWFYIIAIAP